MTDRRELEGIGYHYADDNDDCLVIEQWIKRPDDLKGQALTVGRLLPRDYRDEAAGRYPGGNYAAKAPPRKFRFRIILEINREG